MASLYELRTLLFRIKAKLVEHPVFTRQAGLPADDPAHARELAELDRLELQLSLVLRELGNRSNSLSVRRDNLWNVKPEHRFRVAASIRSQQEGVNEVLALGREIQRLCEDLIRKSGTVGEGEIAQGIGELIEKLYHQAHAHGETNGMPDGIAYISPKANELGGSVEGVTILVFVALRAFLHLAKRKPGNES
ncbi:MAG TPA: hypothetical protein VL967_14140 [Terracidiphilus sp.]|nr:hypothetical protein [Terracidiphilus sp.]